MSFLVDAAEIEEYLAVVPRWGLELVMRSEHYYDVGLVERLLVWGGLGCLALLDVWLYNHYVSIVAHLHNLADDVLGG